MIMYHRLTTKEINKIILCFESPTATATVKIVEVKELNELMGLRTFGVFQRDD